MKGLLFRNFLSLTALQGASYLLALLSVPYLVRTLGTERFGLVAFGQAFIQYFVILTDYGFNFSATRAASVSRHDPAALASLYWGVTAIKVALMLAGAAIMCLAVALVPALHGEWALYGVSYLTVLGNVLFPVWLFQGLERMGEIALFSVVARLLAVGALFVLVRQPGDYVLAAALQAIAAPVAGVFSIWLLLRRGDIPLREHRGLNRRTLIRVLGDGWHIFVSTAAVALYSSSNVFVLGIVASASVVGYYAMADKLMRAAVGLLAPLAQALYPRMSYQFSRDVPAALRELKTVATVASVPTGILSAVLLLGGRPLVRILFGPDAGDAVELLAILSLVPLLVLWSNVLGVQLLYPLGRQADVSRFQVLVGVISVLVLIPMAFYWGATGTAINYLLAEIAITLGYGYLASRALKDVRMAEVARQAC